jgi:EmrB/QacA subfamily drug resistance transporter
VPNVEPKNVAPIMFGLMLSLFLANLDQTIVATCLPAIAHDLQGWELLTWIISAYLVTSTATTPIYGRLSDHYGRRPVMLASIAIFVLASIFCALANTMPLLIAARILQGLGGGGLRSISLIVIADIIPPRYRGQYQGYMSTAFLIATTLGPVLGGFFAEHLSWRWAFWINLPLGAIAFVVVNRQLRNLKIPTMPHKIDWLGALLILASAVPLMIGISRVEQEGGWLHWPVIFPILLGIAATAALVGVELRVTEPMIPMRLFANKVFTVGNIAIFAPSMVLTALVVIVPLYYQIVLKWPADQAGLQLIALTGGMAIGTFIVGSVISRLGRAKMFALASGLAATALCVLISYAGLGRSVLFDVVCTTLLGAALGCQINPLNLIVQNGLEIRDIGAGVAGLTFFRSLGGAFGVAAFSTFLIGRLAAGAVLVPGHEKLGADPGIGLLRQDAVYAFDGTQLAAFTGVLQHAFALVFILAAGISLASVFAVATINESPLRTSTGRR